MLIGRKNEKYENKVCMVFFALTISLCLILVPLVMASNDWTMFRHDAAHSGNSTSSPSSSVQLWDFTTGNFVYSSPAVVGGVVYVGSSDNKIYAIGEGAYSGVPTIYLVVDCSNNNHSCQVAALALRRRK